MEKKEKETANVVGVWEAASIVGSLLSIIRYRDMSSQEENRIVGPTAAWRIGFVQSAAEHEVRILELDL